MAQLGAVDRFVLGRATVDLRDGGIFRAGRRTPLTPREVAVLSELHRGPVKGFHALRQVIYRLRTKLPEGAVVNGPLGYELAPGPTPPRVIGREAEWAAAEAALHRSGRLLLFGVEGAGKTRFARAMAKHLRAVGFEPLWMSAPRATSPAALEGMVRGVLGLPTGTGLRAALSRLPPTVLVFDAVDVATIAPLLDRWAAASPHHRWLLTSRTATADLDAVRLSTLDAEAARELFVEAGGEDMSLLEDVEALPLVLELLARSPGEQARTLADVVARLWRRLPPRGQSALARLRVFVGSFDGIAAERVAGANDDDLALLCAHAALERREDRYALLSSVRGFDHPEALPVERHATWALDMAARQLESGESAALAALTWELHAVLSRPLHAEQRARAFVYLARIAWQNRGAHPDPELGWRLLDELGQAPELQVALAEVEVREGSCDRALRALGDLEGFEASYWRGQVHLLQSSAEEARELFEAAREAAETDDQRARARLRLARAQQLTGDLEAAEATARGVLDHPPTSEHAVDAGNSIGVSLLYGDPAGAVEVLEAASELAEREGHTYLGFRVLFNLGSARCALGEFQDGERAFVRLQQLAPTRGDRLSSTKVGLMLAQLALDRGALERCEAVIPPPCANERINTARLSTLASLAVRRRQHARAADLMGEAVSLALPLDDQLLLTYLRAQWAFALALAGDLAAAAVEADRAQEASRSVTQPYLALLADLARLAVRAGREPAYQHRAIRAAQQIDRASTHPEVRRNARVLQRHLRERVDPDLFSPTEEAPEPDPEPEFRLGALRVDLGRLCLETPGGEQRLTALEGRLLAALWAKRGQAVDRRELMAAVWGGLRSARTLDQAVLRLRRKIEPDPKHPLFLQSVYGVGYKLDPFRDRRSGGVNRNEGR